MENSNALTRNLITVDLIPRLYYNLMVHGLMLVCCVSEGGKENV
jgi:hypothetical protein